jgi:hypothetical protein
MPQASAGLFGYEGHIYSKYRQMGTKFHQDCAGHVGSVGLRSRAVALAKKLKHVHIASLPQGLALSIRAQIADCIGIRVRVLNYLNFF